MKIKPQVLGRYLQYTYNHRKTIVANIFLKTHKSIIFTIILHKTEQKIWKRVSQKRKHFVKQNYGKSPILFILRGIKIKMQWDSYHFTHSVGRNLEFDSTKIGEDMGTPSHCWSRISFFQLNDSISSVSCQNCLIYTFLCSSF